jgi:hypothetical protein
MLEKSFFLARLQLSDGSNHKQIDCYLSVLLNEKTFDMLISHVQMTFRASNSHFK